MAGRRDDDQIVAACDDRMTVRDLVPRDAELLVLARPGLLQETRARMFFGEPHGTARVIGVPVRDEHIGQSRAAGVERCRHIGDVRGHSDAGIHEYRRSVVVRDEICVVPGAGHGAGIAGREEQRIEHLETIAKRRGEV